MAARHDASHVANRLQRQPADHAYQYAPRAAPDAEGDVGYQEQGEDDDEEVVASGVRKVLEVGDFQGAGIYRALKGGQGLAMVFG